jgi:hypothetical protein
MWLKVQSEAGHTLRLSWGNRAGPYPLTYSIATETLKNLARELRTELDGLTGWARSQNAEVRARQLPRLLRLVADAGSRIRYVLFDHSDAAEIEDWLRDEYAAGDKALWITADPDLHLPWGLVFDGDSRAISDQADSIAAFDGFWSLKYSLSTVLSGCEQPRDKVTRSRASFRLLSLINRHAYAQAPSDHRDRYREFDQLLDIPVGKAFNVEVCDQLIDAAAQKDTIFHFFGHHKDGRLDLGDEQSIDIIKFRMMMDRLTDRRRGRHASSCSLVFLNACESALGESDYSLRSAAARPGLCGLIATETVVPREFALRFGLSLLESIVNQGRSIGETMEALRRDPDLWPLSLLYGCYAYPEYRIAPQADP